jgi:hypothetical protein
VVYLTDVTERRRALAALQESEARLQGIAANVPGLVFRLERAPVTGQIDLPISVKAARVWWVLAGHLAHRDKGLRSLVHPDDKAIITRPRTTPWTPTATGHGRGAS